VKESSECAIHKCNLESIVFQVKLLKSKTQIKELPLWIRAGKVGGIRFACGKDSKRSWLAAHCELLH